MQIGINASRARSGGARAHLAGILSELDPQGCGIHKIHLFAYKDLLDGLPNFPWLVKHCPVELSKGLLVQLWWEKFRLPMMLADVGCDVLLNVDAGSVCRFLPSITMSRDMLSYEPGEMDRYKFNLARVRLFALKHVQNAALRHATGVVFLTNYAAHVIQKSCGELKNVKIIPHGVSDLFRNKTANDDRRSNGGVIRLLYVSNVDLYKHQWHVVAAAEILRLQGVKVQLTLIGGGDGPASERLNRQIIKSDPEGEYVKCLPFLQHEKIPDQLACADIFVFASSCENMPNTLVEAMAAGLPIVSSDRGPMPEILGDAGLYFNPESPESIASAIHEMASNESMRLSLSRKSKLKSNQYSWKICAEQTWRFVYSTKTAKSERGRSFG
ncbi:glycosyltransferase family 4 protein [Candidatus Puniceispirillum sp.]|nr:glycosyltransferase family 4 protein [Candidatus Puniceispirillum sp.]